MNQQIKKLLEDIKLSDKEITVYGMSHCPACQQLKEKLEMQLRYLQSLSDVRLLTDMEKSIKGSLESEISEINQELQKPK